MTWLAIADSNANATRAVRIVPDEMNVSANRNSFHSPMNANNAVAGMAGRIIGRKTRVTTCHGVAPSMIAASSISSGKSGVNVVISQT